jgi:hypothetical protein
LRADLIDLHAMSLVESPKSVLAPIWAPITVMCTGGGALYVNMDGPQPRAGRSAHAQGAVGFANNTWISLLGGTLSGRRHPKFCLGIGIPSKMPLYDVESKRGGD